MKICFVSPSIYPCLTGDFSSGNIGGAELQQSFISKQLVKQGLEVSVITIDHGQADLTEIEGLKILKCYKASEGIPLLRYYYPRIWKIWYAMRKADSDIYYVRCAGFLPGIIRLFCLMFDKKYVFAGAHDTDFIPTEHKIRYKRDKWLYHYGLRHANEIIVQTVHQQKLLKKYFQLNSTIIKNFSPLPILDNSTNGNLILWVSTIRKWKRPFQFIKLARIFSHEKFVMIGGKDNSEPELYEQVLNEAKKIDNLDFLGFQPLEITEKYFDQCKVFINTSYHEGFPNTFLQAWRRGIPVISYVDPDNVIKNNGLGKSVYSTKTLQDALFEYKDSITLDVSNHIKNYYQNNHHNGVIHQYCTLFQKILD